MGTFFRRLFILVALVVGLGVLIISLLLNLFEPQLTQQALKTINRNLTTEFQVQNMDITLLRTFPDAAINLRQVHTIDKFGDTLMRAENLALR
ncbi:MAG: hypothetical protein AAF738_11985, partial [Bacteroidota bacterium]